MEEDVEIEEIPKPQEICEALDDYVIGQEQAKRTCQSLSIITISELIQLKEQTKWNCLKVIFQ